MSENSELDPQYTTITSEESSEETTAQPSEYDKVQDEKLAEKDAEIQRLRDELAAKNNAAPETANVVEVPSDEGAKFHEVPAPTSDETQVGGTVGDLPLTETPEVEVSPAPELSPETPVGSVENQNELREAVAEIHTMVREIHETVSWVKEQAPILAAALQDSPFGKMLPTFLSKSQPF